MKFPRIQPYRTSLVDDDGKRTRLDAREIVLERPIVDARGEKTAISARSFAVQVGPGLELKVDLTPEAPWAHHVHIQTFDGPLALFLSAANVVHVSVERAPR
jgi:hypothetical protein